MPPRHPPLPLSSLQALSLARPTSTSTSTSTIAASPLFHLHRFLAAPSPPLPLLLRLHAVAATSGLASRPLIAAKLVASYSAAGRPHLAALAFADAAASPPDAFLWNSLLQAHFVAADFAAALSAHRRMRASGASPTRFTVPLAAAACAELRALAAGSCVHSYSVKFGLVVGDGSVAAASSLVYMYAKCGSVSNAIKLFDEMPVRDVVSWTAVISGCVRNGECAAALLHLVRMLRAAGHDGARPNWRTMESGLEACGLLGALPAGKCLHGYLVSSGLRNSQSLVSSLFTMYSKCESTEDASILFRELPEKDVVSWTSLIGAYCRKGLVMEAVELFWSFELSGVEPDGVLVGCVLAGLANSCNVAGGKAFHAVTVRRNFGDSLLIGNALVSMYCKFELLDVAEKVFRVSHQRDTESWNLMVTGYSKAGFDVKCLDMYREMQFRNLDGFLCDPNSLASAITSCSRLAELRLGQSAHCYSIKGMIDANLSIANMLVGMYGRCGKFDLANKVFDHVASKRDVVTWNALIACYAHHGHFDDALSLFDQMLVKGVEPNSATLITALSACANLAALQRGKSIHAYVKEMDLELDVSIHTALVDMYAKCGQLGIARAIFDSMFEKDVVSWNVMISAYGMHGDAKEALDLFSEMEKGTIKPNGVTFLAVLSACSHVGLVEAGRRVFIRMGEYSIKPNLKHYACIVDLLGKSGYLLEAEHMVSTMPIQPDGGIWGALLGACKMHGHVEMGERVAKMAFDSDPGNDGYYILMSNTYGTAKKWDEVEKLRGMMKNYGVKKDAGWSTVEVGG